MGNSNNLNSRLDRQKKRKGDRLLNILIATVVIAIVIVAFIVIPGGKEEAGEERNQNQGEEIVQEDEKEQDDLEDPADVQEAEQEELEIDEPEEQEDGELVITEEPNDPVVAQSIVDPAWTPIQTAQVGDHVSMYDGTSIDWQEKIAALTYATGLPEEGMTIWRLKNGGSPQKSIGIVSSKDKAEKYRVYLDWIDGEGWKPVKMDVLNTLEFDY